MLEIQVMLDVTLMVGMVLVVVVVVVVREDNSCKKSLWLLVLSFLQKEEREIREEINR